MVSYDTLKLEVPPKVVRSVNWDAFTETTRTKLSTGQTDTFRKAVSEALPVGLVALQCKEGGLYQLTLSAKSLRDDYLSGINLNTWVQALAVTAPVMDIDANRLWDANPRVLLCDTTDNVPLDMLHATQKEVCQAVQAAKMNDRFVSKWYESRTKLGVEFQGTQDEKNRLIFYSKDLDLLKPANKKFMHTIVNPSKMLEAAMSSIRVEANHTSFKSMRQRFGINDNNLQQILSAPMPVNHNFLMKVINHQRGQLSLFEQYRDMNVSPHEFILRKGVETIIQELGCNELEVKQFFKHLFGEKFKYHWYKNKSRIPISEIVREVKARKVGDVRELHGICHRVLEALKNMAA